MYYLSTDDLITYSQEQFINSSSQNNSEIIDALEKVQIAIIKSYLGTRYDVEAIFNENEPIHDEVLKSIIARMLLFRLFKRNQARVVPVSSKEDYEAAMKELFDISTGRTPLTGLPAAPSSGGSGTGNTTNSNSLWGNNTNQDFYI